MASQWFIRSSSKTHGPFSSSDLKRFAESGKIKPETQVASSQKGPWHTAAKVRGLFPASQQPTVTSSGTAKPTHSSPDLTSLRQLCDAVDAPDFFVASDLTEKQLNSACRAFEVPATQLLVAIIDGSTFKTGTLGLAICADGIRWKNDFSVDTTKSYLTWDELRSLEPQLTSKKHIDFGNAMVADLSDTRFPLSNVVPFLRALTAPRQSGRDGLAQAPRKPRSLRFAYKEAIGATFVSAVLALLVAGFAGALIQRMIWPSEHEVASGTIVVAPAVRDEKNSAGSILAGDRGRETTRAVEATTKEDDASDTRQHEERTTRHEAIPALARNGGRAAAQSGHAELKPLRRETLTVAQAEALAKEKRDEPLSLDGLTTLPVDVAEALACHKGGLLSLDGLTVISDGVAEALAKYEGELWLNGVTTISNAQAAHLARHKGGWLSLHGLTSLSETASKLLKSNGEVYISKKAVRLTASQTAAGSVLPLDERLNSVGMAMILIPAGEFLMGSDIEEAGYASIYKAATSDEQPPHLVGLSRPFRFSKTEVTRRQWETVMGTRPWEKHGVPSDVHMSDAAVIYVSWDDARAFCSRLTLKEIDTGHLVSGEEYRLPTEAEWEYACRAGTQTYWSFGNSQSAHLCTSYAWTRGVSDNGGRGDDRYAHKVSAKKPNPWGLHDMHGNVAEWCSDLFDADYYATQPAIVDPQGPRVGELRVIRGGSWASHIIHCRSANRGAGSAANVSDAVGFRVALTVKASDSTWNHRSEGRRSDAPTDLSPSKYVVGFRDEDLPQLCDAIWQNVIGLSIPLGGLQSSEEWQSAMRKERGVICPQRINDMESLYSAIDYLTGIKDRIAKLRNSDDRSEDREAGEFRTHYDAYLSALDFFYHVSGAKGQSKTLANRANQLVTDRYMDVIFDTQSGKAVPSPYVSVETSKSAVEGPAKDAGTRFAKDRGTLFESSESGLTLTFWNVSALLSDKEFVPFILSRFGSAEQPPEATNGQ